MSTHSGVVVKSFPYVASGMAVSVCRVPGVSPVPIPYPNTTAAAPVGTQSKAPVAPKAQAADPSGQLRATLLTLHNQIIALSGSDPARWQALLDGYVVTAANLYVALADR